MVWDDCFFQFGELTFNIRENVALHKCLEFLVSRQELKFHFKLYSEIDSYTDNCLLQILRQTVA